ncbi:MAG: NifU family protein [Propionibacteriaceae bacterium]|jgi:Fe/S biogenesis protein NfuA|nr:NifU family protein [Propionibacteriaceae bacterium]
MADLTNRIEAVLAERVRPVLALHGGDISFASLEDNVVHVTLHGECVGCPAADMSMHLIVKEELLGALPELSDVVLDGGVSDELIAQAKLLMGHHKFSAPPPRLLPLAVANPAPAPCRQGGAA